MSYADREKIEQLLQQGYSVSVIAREIGFTRAAIYQELKRTGLTRQNYTAERAVKANKRIRVE